MYSLPLHWGGTAKRKSFHVSSCGDSYNFPSAFCGRFYRIRLLWVRSREVERKPSPSSARRWLNLVLISRRSICDVVAGCNWQSSAICPSGCPAHLRWIADVRTRICAKCKSNCACLNHFTRKYGSKCLTGVRCVRRWCSHKMFSSPTIADNRRLACEVELSSTSQASRRSMSGKDYDSAINVHICRNVVPGRAGGYVPGMSAAYENQALPSHENSGWKDS